MRMTHSTPKAVSLAMALAFALQLLAGAMCFMLPQTVAAQSLADAGQSHCHEAAMPVSSGLMDELDMSALSLDGHADMAAGHEHEASSHGACVHCDAPDQYVAAPASSAADVASSLVAVLSFSAVLSLVQASASPAFADAQAPPQHPRPLYLTTQRLRI